jgi:glycosyltransferase involved in cell wall biosynthesis
MPDEPLFSVVIPTHARAELLDLAVRSVLRQTISDFEVLVVDDGGTGVRLSVEDPRVRVIPREKRGGAAAARNDGIAAARGRYLTFLDDDDEFTPDRLALGLDGLEHAPIALCWKAGLLEGDLRWSRSLYGPVAGLLLEAPVPQLGSAAVRRDLVLPLDDALPVSEDVEWWLRMSDRGEVHTVPRVGYLIRDHEGERLRDRTRDRLDVRLQLLAEHRAYFERHRRAAAYQWLRAGGLAGTVGDHRTAVRCFARAVRCRPSRVALARLATAGGHVIAQTAASRSGDRRSFAR